MKSVKKLSMLVALILCVTVGGVYAAWTYSGSDVADQTMHRSAALTEAKFEGTFGTYQIDPSGVDFWIDQTAVGDYTPDLEITGNLIVSFTPGANVPEEIKENGYTSYVKFTSPNKYLGHDIFTFGSPITINPANASEGEKWVKDGNKFTYTVTAEKLMQLIDITSHDDFYLDTKDKYDDFNEVLTGVNVNIGDGIATSAN